jgi:ATP-dependent DNA helicase RecG
VIGRNWKKRGVSDLKLSLRKSRLALLLIFANIFDAIMISLIRRDSLLSCSQPTQSKPYFDDRIEIENPGVLIPGLSLDDLPRGISRLRNRMISRVFRELGLIEQWGSGIPVILEEAASQHLPPPLFEEVGLRFRVTLPLAQASSPAQGQSRPRGAESRAESLAEGGLAEMVIQALADGPLNKSGIARALGRDSVSGALNRTIRQLLDRDEIGYTLPETPNSRLQKYRRMD